MKILQDLSKKKIMKSTIITIVLFIVTIALYIELNIIIEKLHIPEKDITTSKLYSISDNTENRVKNIDKEVKITLYNFDEYMGKSNINNSVAIIEKYSELNKNIHVEKNNSTNYTEPTIVVSCGENKKEINVNYLYTYKFSTNTYTDIEYDLTEQELTNAIMEVTSQSKKNIYFCISHSAYGAEIQNIYATIISRISTKLNDIYMINITNAEKIPDDCDVLIISRVVEDFSDEEKSKLVDYINNGGDIVVLQDAKTLIKSQDTPNYQEILDMYGVNISDSLIMESGSENMLINMPDFILPKVNEQSNIGKKLENDARLFMIYAAKINFADQDTLDNLNVSYEVIAKSSEESFLRNDIANTSKERIETDEDSPNAVVAALVTKDIGENKKSKLLIFSNSVFISDYNIAIQDKVTSEVKNRATLYVNDNEAFFEQAIRYLANNEESLLLQKSYSNSVPTIKLIENDGIVKLFFSLPLIVLCIGIIVWRHRKNKK